MVDNKGILIQSHATIFSDISGLSITIYRPNQKLSDFLVTHIIRNTSQLHLFMVYAHSAGISVTVSRADPEHSGLLRAQGDPNLKASEG